MSIRVHPDDLANELLARFARMPEVIIDGLNEAANEGVAILARRTPRATGSTAAQWRVRPGRAYRNQYGRGGILPEIYNGAPHVGVLEMGARPHPVSADGIAALTRWAQIQLGLDPVEAAAVARAIAWKIRKRGAKPTYFVRDSRPDLAAAMVRGVVKHLTKFAAGPAGRGRKR